MSEEKKFPIEPLFDRVFVVKDDLSVDKKTGFALPSTVKGRAYTGTVIAVGPGYYNTATGDFFPMTLKVGDKIVIKEFDGYIMRYDGLPEFFVFMERDILGVLKDGN